MRDQSFLLIDSPIRIDLSARCLSCRVNGEPTEGALKVLVEKIGAPHPEENAKIQEKRNKDPSRHVEAVCECYRKNYNDVRFYKDHLYTCE